MANSFDAKLTQLAESVANVKTVSESAVAFIQGVRQEIDNAVAAASLTPEQELVFSDLDASLDGHMQDLADAIVANT